MDKYALILCADDPPEMLIPYKEYAATTPIKLVSIEPKCCIKHFLEEQMYGNPMVHARITDGRFFKIECNGTFIGFFFDPAFVTLRENERKRG